MALPPSGKSPFVFKTLIDRVRSKKTERTEKTDLSKMGTKPELHHEAGPMLLVKAARKALHDLDVLVQPRKKTFFIDPKQLAVEFNAVKFTAVKSVEQNHTYPKPGSRTEIIYLNGNRNYSLSIPHLTDGQRIVEGQIQIKGPAGAKLFISTERMPDWQIVENSEFIAGRDLVYYSRQKHPGKSVKIRFVNRHYDLDVWLKINYHRTATGGRRVDVAYRVNGKTNLSYIEIQ